MSELDDLTWWLLLALVAIAAALYSSVGHGGASGYLAAMALFGLPADVMKPAALTMNIGVAALVLWRLARAGHFDWRLFLPFALGSIPLAALGGAYTLNDATYRYLVSGALLIAAARLAAEPRDTEPRARLAAWMAVAIGAGLGLLSGLTGVGGGIFLSPVLLLLRWTNMRSNAAMAAAFILVNSIAGLAGYAAAGGSWPAGVAALVVAALIGGALGSELVLRRLAPARLKKLLALVLLIAALKMILAA